MSHMALTDLPASTLAGVITAVAAVFTALGLVITAIGGLLRSRRLEGKVDQVHVIVNQQRTDMQTVIVNQQRQLLALEESMARAGLAIPVTPETTGEPIVSTAVIVHEDKS